MTDPKSRAAPRLLAISPGRGDVLALERWAADLARAGVAAIELREKGMTDRLICAAARRVRAVTPDLLVLVHRRPDVARAAGADGVHLPSDGLPTGAVRRRFGADFWIGRSTHTVVELERACEQGADYAVFGPVFESPYHRPAVGLTTLRRAVEAARPLPILALGGVGPDQFAAVRDCGAWGAAGIRAFATAEAAHAFVDRAAA